MKTLKIDENKALELYSTASKELKEVFHATFGEDFFKPKSLFDKIKTYKDVCKELNEEEITEDYFDIDTFTRKEIKQLVAFARIKQIVKLFNGNWNVDLKDPNQYKYYPYFNMAGSGLVFGGSSCFTWAFDGQVAYFKDNQTSDFVGKTFVDIYQDLY